MGAGGHKAALQLPRGHTGARERHARSFACLWWSSDCGRQDSISLSLQPC
jgi:hypothetical protein